LSSTRAEAINAKRDLHRLVAARVLDKEEGDVSDEERCKAKPINFGKPGGMGLETLILYAKVNYGVRLSREEAEALSEAWLSLFPEMKSFLGDATDTAGELARLFGMTPASHYEHTDDRRFLHHPDNAGHQHQPHQILGGMCLKALKVAEPMTNDGRPYRKTDIDYFWSCVENRAALLTSGGRKAVLERRPSVKLQREVMALAGRAGVFTLSGRLRAAATYSARHNTVFQGLAADGAKLALWRLWRAGYRIVNFVHDQVLVEVPAASNLKRHAEKVKKLMIAGMREVVPDVDVDVSYAAADRWYKKAKAVFSTSGKKLLLWRPE
jgi:hypothetical protein